jgi:hypothetical protein
MREQASTIRRLFKADNAEPFLKGRATVFIVDRRYDYVEFGSMVAKRQWPNSQQAHWQYSPIDAYAVILFPTDEDLPEALFAEQIAALYISSWGSEIPRWFATSLSRAVAARMEPRDAMVSQWHVPTARGDFQPADLITGKAPAEIADPILFVFGQQILRNGRACWRLTTQLQAGQPFADAWQETYGMSPQDSLASWVQERGFN